MANEPSIGQMNEAIGRFMGGIKQIIPKGGLHGYKEGTVLWMYLFSDNADPVQALEYHTSWDWLMPVVEKIHGLKAWREDKKDLEMFSTISIGLDFDGHYNNCRCSVIGTITYCHNQKIPHTYTKVRIPDIWIHGAKTALEATYKAVYQFITWFNQQKQNDEY